MSQHVAPKLRYQELAEEACRKLLAITLSPNDEQSRRVAIDLIQRYLDRNPSASEFEADEDYIPRHVDILELLSQ